MPAYAVGILYDVKPHPDLVVYLEKIDATLEPFGGRFIVHGAEPEVREGDFNARFVVILFADLDKVRAWYDSEAYQAILSLRPAHSNSVIFFVDGIVGPHAATDVLKAGFTMRRSGRKSWQAAGSISLVGPRPNPPLFSPRCVHYWRAALPPALLELRRTSRQPEN